MKFDPADGVRPMVRREGLVVERIDDELLIYDRERDKAHRLNETAALVFSRCDGTRSISELTAHVSAEAGRPVDEEVVELALARLGDEDLLEQPLSEIARGHEWSRRQVILRVAMAGAAAGIGLPVVKSIVAPTPAQAQASCIPAGDTEANVCSSVQFACQEVGNGPHCCPSLTCSPSTALPGLCTCQSIF